MFQETWCLGPMNSAFRARMEQLLRFYRQTYDPERWGNLKLTDPAREPDSAAHHLQLAAERPRLAIFQEVG